MELFFGQHRIYFPKDVSEHIGPIQRAMKEAFVTFAGDLRHQADGPMPQPERERRLNAWRKARDIVTEILPDLIEAIEASMRAVLAGDAVHAPIQLAPIAASGTSEVRAEPVVVRGVVEQPGKAKDLASEAGV
jgi:hypothetical protein